MVVAVVPLRGANGVGQRSYSDRFAWLQAPLSYYLALHVWRALGGAVWCQGGGASRCGGPGWSWAGCHPPALEWEVGEPLGPHAAPQLPVRGGAEGSGPTGSLVVSGGSRTRWTPATAVTSWVRRKACTLFRASGAGRGGQSTGAAP